MSSSNTGMHPIEEELSEEDLPKAISNLDIDSCESVNSLHKKLTEIKSRNRSNANEESDEGSDTDLEIEEPQCEYDMTGKMIYLEACKGIGVIPVSYVIRHMGESVMNLAHHGLGALGVKALAVPLMNNSTVETLDLEDNWLEGEGGEYVADVMSENVYIANLNLSNNKLGRRGGLAINRLLQNNGTLDILDVSGNDIGDVEGECLAEALLENNRLRVLKLSHNNLGESNVKKFADALVDNDGLEVVDLSWNNFRLKSALHICAGIASSVRLREINLSMNGLANEGAFGVADIVKQSPSLTSLDVSYNRIGVPGTTVIAKQLETNGVLKAFKIGHNPLGPEGALILLNSIATDSSRLIELDLSGIEVDKDFKAKKEEVLSTRKLTLVHGPVLSDYVIMIEPNGAQLFSTSAAELSNENIFEVMRTYCEINDIDLKGKIEIKDPDFQLSMSDLIVCLSEVGIELSNNQQETLENLLTDFCLADGKLNLSALK